MIDVKTIIPFLIACGFVLSANAQTRSLEGKAYPNAKNVAGQALELRGLGVAKYLVFKVMTGGLYLPKGVPSEKVLANVPKYFEVAYLVDAPAADLVKLANKTLAKSLTAAEMAQYKAKIDQANALFRDVKAGERCSITFIPGTGTTVSYNGTPRGTVPGDDFAAAYFKIWFGDKCCSPKMRKQIYSGF